MGNIGSIEKIMVFGILVIIVTILGIAFYSATKMDNDLTANQMDASGQDPVVLLDDPGGAGFQNPGELGPNNPGHSNTPVVKDVRPGNKVNNALDSSFKSLQSNVRLNEQAGEDRTGEGAGPGDMQIADRQNQPEQTPLPNKKEDNKELEYYKVQKGDSFMSIARALLGDERQCKHLMAANPNVDSMSLQIGQKLLIPRKTAESSKNASSKPESTAQPSVAGADRVGKEYVVKSGDTLVTISLAIYGTSSKWKKIYEANRAVIANPDMLSVGDVLTLPQNP
ncbi:MAG: LysM peptidoglycan-binding domain-containing protein [Planctomycetota bacterium]